MKVTLINTLDSGGGAALACQRLMTALGENGVDAKMLVQQKRSDNKDITGLTNGLTGRVEANYNFLAERLPFIAFQERDKSVRFAFSPANTGSDISTNKLVRESDILHIHWTNSGFLSTEDLKKLIDLKKPIVWTLHDMWTFTGGCHYSGICDHFENECGDCYFLRNPGKNDLSQKGWMKKRAMYTAADNITFITCSTWLAVMAKKSSLLGGFRIETIPNPIDTNLFQVSDRDALRHKWNIKQHSKIILFGAANILDRRKGLKYLIEALDVFKNTWEGEEEIEIVIFGKNKSFDTSKLPFATYNLPVITSQQEMAELYGLADLFVLPSLEDNLPNTVMESMSCSTPVVAFNTGGIPDMIDHQVNGYLAEYKSAADLAFGLKWVLENDSDLRLSEAAREKVMNSYTNELVADQYIKLYQSLLNG